MADAVDRREGSLRQIADRHRVSLSSVTRLLRRRRQTGSLDPEPHGGGRPPALDARGLERLRRLVLRRPEATLAELRRELGLDCSLMAIWRALRKLGITREAKGLRAKVGASTATARGHAPGASGSGRRPTAAGGRSRCPAACGPRG